MEFYWELVLKDGTRYEIPPEKVEVVNKRMGNRDPIMLSSATIPYADIDKFRQTSKPYGQQPLLEAVAQVFNDPVYGEDGEVRSRWVKKTVTQRDYNKHYGSVPAYRRLEDRSNMIVVAFTLPIHEIDMQKVDYCTDEEVQRLTR